MNRTWTEYYAPPSEKSKYSTARCAFVIKGFTVLYSGLKEGGIKSVAKGVTHTWPATPADLMPFGADELVKTMLQWYRFVPDPMVVQLTTRILRTARYTLIPSLYKYRLAHTFVDHARKIFDLTVVELHKPRPASDKAYLIATTANVMRYHYILQGVLDFLNEVLDELPRDCIADIMLGCETKFMQLCSLIVYLSSDPCMINHEANEKAIDSFTGHGWFLYRFFHMHLPPHPDIPLHPDIVQVDEKFFPPPPSVRTVPKAVLYWIGTFHMEDRCSAYKCPNSIQSAGRNFQRCGRCHAVSYCGRECQTVTWREEKYPHKRVCRAIRFLVDVAGGPGLFWHTPNSPPIPPEIPGDLPFKGFQYYILENWKKAGVGEDHEDMVLVYDWSKSIEATRNMPNGSTWTSRL